MWLEHSLFVSKMEKKQTKKLIATAFSLLYKTSYPEVSVLEMNN